MENSGILLVVIDPAYTEILAALLEAGGERSEPVVGLAAALQAVRSSHYELVLLILEDARHADDLVDHIRSAANWARSAPVIAISGAKVTGADASIEMPLRAADLTRAIQACAGSDRMPVVANAQREKLSALIGAEQAEAMIGRFLASLADGIAQIEAGGDARAIGHRLGGMGGMLGFHVLGAAWLSLENHGMSAWPTVRELTAEAIVNHRGEMAPGLDRPD